MGKDLKGRELGKGLYQRKDGRYEARAKINGNDVSIYGFNLRELKKFSGAKGTGSKCCGIQAEKSDIK